MRPFTKAVCVLCAVIFLPSTVRAHCDTYSGPVVTAAKQALDKGDVTPVLKWVKKNDEDQVRSAFKKTMAVRAKGPEAKELADTWFFETLVRIHRAGEGEPFTGLKKDHVEPVIAMTDRTLETGKPDTLIKAISAHFRAGINDRFKKVIETKKNAENSVDAGREYVAAYVQYLHYVERIHGKVASDDDHHGAAAKQDGAIHHDE